METHKAAHHLVTMGLEWWVCAALAARRAGHVGHVGSQAHENRQKVPCGRRGAGDPKALTPSPARVVACSEGER
jgi:hypothetical protein